MRRTTGAPVRHSFLFATILISVGACTSAMADCKAVPDVVRLYMRSEPHWSILDTNDLIAEDQMAWERSHTGFCPRIASVDLSGRGLTPYAVALLNHSNGQVIEKVI